MSAVARQYNPQIGPLLQAGIASAGQFRSLAGQPQTQQAALEAGLYEFLLDTGADTTCISPEIIRSLQLSPQGQIEIATPSGVAPANTYLVDIAIPFGNQLFVHDNQQVIEFNGNTNHYKGLIGRDIICSGVLNISFDGRYTFAL